jgi:hypothetical protein
MRLVTTDGTRSMWVWLEPETETEASALQGCVARSEWTNGRGPEAIARLRALAERLGHPVREARRPVAPGSPCLVVVPRGKHDLFERLTLIARADVTVVWDRRLGERRRSDRPTAVDRRRQERRKAPTPWDVTGFLVLPFGDASA